MPPGYDVFSKRDKPFPDVFEYDTIPDRFRHQVQWLWNRAVVPYDLGNLLSSIQPILCEEHGLPFLSRDRIPAHRDVDEALLRCKETGLVLDIIEAVFGVMTAQPGLMRIKPKEAIVTLNHRFRENGIGYEFDANAKRLIRIDSTLIHAEAVKPSLALLNDPRFRTANSEMLEAWEDFRKGDYDDCLLKCGKAFESTLKIVCGLKRWPHNPTDTAQPLVRCVIQNGDLPAFFEQMLMIVATLRNKFAAHGQGATPQHVPENFARYALNATSSAILLVAGLV